MRHTPDHELLCPECESPDVVEVSLPTDIPGLLDYGYECERCPWVGDDPIRRPEEPDAEPEWGDMTPTEEAMYARDLRTAEALRRWGREP
jgi:hypothetical protein